MKLNVDASFIEETGQASTGAVVRNHQGHVLVSAWRVLFDCFSVEEAEFAVCCEKLRLVSQWCHGQIIMESDNKTCIRSLMLEESGRSRLAPWIVDAKEYISNLEDFKLKHVKRCQNTVAHELSHHARRVN